MTELETRLLTGDPELLDEDALAAFISERRWYGARERSLTDVAIVHTVPISDDPVLVVALVDVTFQTGTSERYQLLLGIRDTDGPTESSLWTLDSQEVYEALEDPRRAGVLIDRLAEGAAIGDEGSGVRFHAATAVRHATGAPRSAGRDQSNTSVVFDDDIFLKWYRHLEPGINPELELLQFLAGHDFAHTPRLVGWVEQHGHPLDATLGIFQHFVADAIDGWELVVGALRAKAGDSVLDALAGLGAVTGELHATLAADHSDPAFIPEEVSPEGLALMGAALDEVATEVLASLPDEPGLTDVSRRADEVRARLQGVSKGTGLGRKIRVHGDLHLGQALRTDGRWHLVDFEGEPARPVNERRRKRSPLRDVAGLVRSIDYAARAVQLHHGVEVPDAWLQSARDALLDGYFAVVEPTGLLPPSTSVTHEVLGLYELEKAIYELRYEVAHRPGWAAIPAAGIAAILDAA